MKKLNVNKKLSLTATTDFGNWLNGKMVLYLEDLANPKTRLNSIPNHHTPIQKKRD